MLEADARRFAETMKIPFFETSAKVNINVEEVTFFIIASKCPLLGCSVKLVIVKLRVPTNH